MEYILNMFRSRLQRIDLLTFGGSLTVIAILIPAVWVSFVTQNPNRWPAAGLSVAFALLFFADTWICALRPRMAYFYMAVQTLLVLALLLLVPQFGFLIIMYFVLSVQLRLLFPERTGIIWIGAFALASASYLVRVAGWADTLFILPIYLGGFFFFAAFARQTARAEAARRESQGLLDELQKAHDQLQEYAAQAEELAVVEERNRLAREMHDTLGHRLTVAAVQLEGAERLIPGDPDKASRMVRTVRQQVKEALSELRRTVATLRAPVEADLSLPRALRRLATGFESATGITMHLMAPDELPELSSAQRVALYRAAQESLTNIQRHAQARDAWLQLSSQNGTMTLVVRDNGVGLPDSAGLSGFGIRGLRERALQLGGGFTLQPRPGRGTQVSFHLPLGQEQPYE